MCVTPPVIPHFSALAPGYDVLLSDVWGVVHNGVRRLRRTPCEALMRARGNGAAVILVTNAPRPSEAVIRQLDRLQVPREAYDAHCLVRRRDPRRDRVAAGQTFFHLGPERDRSIFHRTRPAFAPLETADYVVCSGLFDDEVETPDDYRDRLAAMLSENCSWSAAIPDVVVERGDRLVYCAGALADFTPAWAARCSMPANPTGRSTTWRWRRAEARRGRKAALRRVLAIGDSVRTDLTGARDSGCRFPVRRPQGFTPRNWAPACAT